MYCTSCGKKMDMLSKFCPNCGKKAASAKVLQKLTKPILNAIPILYRIYVKLNTLKKLSAPYYGKIARFMPVISGLALAIVMIVTFVIPAYGRRMFDIGMEYISNMRYAEAVHAFSWAIAAGVNGPEINAILGEAYINLGEFERAREHLRSGDDLTPLKLRLLADVYYHEGNEHMHRNTLRELIQITPNDPYAYFRLSSSYRSAGLLENAASVLEGLLARQRNSRAQVELYNIYIESFAVNTSTERAALIRQDVMGAISSAYIESLDVGGGEALSLSPSGRFVAVHSVEDSRRYIDVYELLDSEFRLLTSFRIPVNYLIDPGMIAWSPDETMFAFFNSAAEEFVSDSAIFLCHIIEESIENITDPGADFARYMGPEGVFVIDTLPVFSSDSGYIYFARRTPMGNSLAVVDISSREVRYLAEPPMGGFIDYKIIERAGRVFFSVAGPSNNPLWGIYVYENGSIRQLEIDYDNRLYYLALKEITEDGRFLLYYLTVASQNDSMFFGVVNLETMENVLIYSIEHDIANDAIVAMNRSSVFGAEHRFITRNMGFGHDGRSLVVAEEGLNGQGKVIRRFLLSGSGVGSFVYMSFDSDGAGRFAAARRDMNKGGQWFREVRNGEFLIYDNGFRLLRVAGT